MGVMLHFIYKTRINQAKATALSPVSTAEIGIRGSMGIVSAKEVNRSKRLKKRYPVAFLG